MVNEFQIKMYFSLNKSDMNETAAALRKTQTFSMTHWSPAFTLTGVDCVLMKLDPEMYRNAQRVRYFPKICHRYYHGIDIDPAFCSKKHFAYDLPWAMLNGIINRYEVFVDPCKP